MWRYPTFKPTQMNRFSRVLSTWESWHCEDTVDKRYPEAKRNSCSVQPHSLTEVELNLDRTKALWFDAFYTERCTKLVAVAIMWGFVACVLEGGLCLPIALREHRFVMVLRLSEWCLGRSCSLQRAIRESCLFLRTSTIFPFSFFSTIHQHIISL